MHVTSNSNYISTENISTETELTVAAYQEIITTIKKAAKDMAVEGIINTLNLEECKPVCRINLTSKHYNETISVIRVSIGEIDLSGNSGSNFSTKPGSHILKQELTEQALFFDLILNRDNALQAIFPVVGRDQKNDLKFFDLSCYYLHSSILKLNNVITAYDQGKSDTSSNSHLILKYFEDFILNIAFRQNQIQVYADCHNLNLVNFRDPLKPESSCVRQDRKMNAINLVERPFVVMHYDWSMDHPLVGAVRLNIKDDAHSFNILDILDTARTSNWDAMLIPVLPTVYTPMMDPADITFFKTIKILLEDIPAATTINHLDACTGTGVVMLWVEHLLKNKCLHLVLGSRLAYDINPLAAANAATVIGRDVNVLSRGNMVFERAELPCQKFNLITANSPCINAEEEGNDPTSLFDYWDGHSNAQKFMIDFVGGLETYLSDEGVAVLWAAKETVEPYFSHTRFDIELVNGSESDRNYGTYIIRWR